MKDFIPEELIKTKTITERLFNGGHNKVINVQGKNLFTLHLSLFHWILSGPLSGHKSVRHFLKKMSNEF